VSRVGVLHRLKGVNAGEASMRYHEELMGEEAAAAAAAGEGDEGTVEEAAEAEEEEGKEAVAAAAAGEGDGGTVAEAAEEEEEVEGEEGEEEGEEGEEEGEVVDGAVGLERGGSSEGAGLGNPDPSASCPVCRGRAVQVQPIKSMLKAPGPKFFRLIFDTLLSDSAFNFNSCRYTTGLDGSRAGSAGARGSIRRTFLGGSSLRGSSAGCAPGGSRPCAATAWISPTPSRSHKLANLIFDNYPLQL